MAKKRKGLPAGTRERDQGAETVEVDRVMDSDQDLDIVEPVARAWEESGREDLCKTRIHDKDFRDAVVARVLDGEKLAHVAREVGLRRSTLQTWLAELKEERAAQDELDSMRLGELFTQAAVEFLEAVDKKKLEKAGIRDLALAAGIAADKRKELIGKQKSAGTTRLRIAWRGGEGAVEVDAGE